VAGQGIALVPYGIACQDLATGALRRIACRSAPFGHGYRFLINPHKEGMTKVQRFRGWMVDEMDEMRRQMEAAGT
jgi:LysR family glycine cleavage system transcriptional activator